METVDLSDYNGKNPGDSGYNIMGAKVKFMEGELEGKHLQYHPKHGIIPVKQLSDPPLSEGEVAKFHKAREKFNAEIATLMGIAIA